MKLRTSILLALAVTLGSCAKKGDHGTVEIFQACASPKPDASTGACVYPTGTCSLVPLDIFDLDVGVTDVMFLGVEVHNQLQDNTATTFPPQTNTHNAFIEGYTVSYGGLDLPETSVPINQTVAAAGSTVVGVRLVEGATAAALRDALQTGGTARITANLSLRGHFGDGWSFTTPVATYGIDVCYGCFVTPTCASGAPFMCPPAGGQYPSSFACPSATGGGGGDSSTFTIGGHITNLTGSGLILTTDGQVSLSVPAGSDTFTFGTAVPSGTTYDVTVLTDPSGQTCTVTGGSGTVGSADVTDIQIYCSP